MAAPTPPTSPTRVADGKTAPKAEITKILPAGKMTVALKVRLIRKGAK
ncbi:unnamed protein product [marine sediment metagenome]|uniref:Uncharacterized protein n=1 Tax=marine sediment metagenome TaxID=412755 RepID=X1JF81_9ZZZZ